MYICPMKKIAVLLFLLVTFSSTAVKSQTVQEADSLFNEKKYTESFEIYKLILEQKHQASPSMLLKMAYIKEGLGGFSDALYYLNLYYLKTADRKVLDKMEELAAKNSLVGYSFNDLEFVQTLFYKYYNNLVVFLLAIAILCLSAVYLLKVKRKSNPSLAAIGMVITLAVLFYTLNFAKDYDRAIVSKSNSYLMSGPSAAAESIKIINKGNRLKVLGYEDIWTKVEVDAKVGFIRSDKLKAVEL